MFRSARLKLTTWYLFIIMLISVSFSIVIYRVLVTELDRVERIERSRIQRGFPERWRIIIPPESLGELPKMFFLDPKVIQDAKNHLKVMLAVVDLIILGTSTLSGYFLAGRTLKPIKEMVEEQNRFVSDASHELRTPLTSLKAEIEVNLRNKKLTLPDAKKLLVSNLEEVNNLQVLSDRLIKLARYQKNINGLNIVSLGLLSVMGEAIKKVDFMAKNKKINIENEINDFNFEGDKQSLVEVFVIFLDNAIKYSLGSSIVNLSSEKIDGNIFISVIDHGIGIDEKDIPHLFDRFFRADKSRNKSDIVGYGLGLSIAKQIIDMHYGKITVKSNHNKGTSFTIQIPVKHSHKLT